MAREGRRGSSLRAGKNFILTIIGTNERVLSKDMFTNFALTVLYKIYSTIAMTKAGQTSVLAGIQTEDSHGSNRRGGVKRQKVLRRQLLDLE